MNKQLATLSFSSDQSLMISKQLTLARNKPRVCKTVQRLSVFSVTSINQTASKILTINAYGTTLVLAYM